MSTDLDTRAREAAAAARASVTRVDITVRPATRSMRPLALMLGGAALTVLTAVGLRIADDAATVIATGPAGQGPSVAPEPQYSPFQPGIGPDGALIGVPLTSGFADKGYRWALYAEGPSRTLCLAVASVAASEPDRAATVCADGSTGDVHRPQVLADPRVPSFVFGRMPAEVTEVTVLLMNGSSLRRQRVAPSPIGQFYAVELPDRRGVVGVIGHRADGTSVRYDL